MKAQVLPIFESSFQIAKREGKVEGKAEGKVETLHENIERLLLKKLLSEAQIAYGLEVPLALVQKIREELIQSGRLDA